MEGTGSYGVALTRRLTLEGIDAFEAPGPRGKGRPIAARTTADARCPGGSWHSDTRDMAAPRTRDGIVEAMREPRIARASAVKSPTQMISGFDSSYALGPAGSGASRSI